MKDIFDSDTGTNRMIKFNRSIFFFFLISVCGSLPPLGDQKHGDRVRSI